MRNLLLMSSNMVAMTSHVTKECATKREHFKACTDPDFQGVNFLEITIG
jgi:hypothetical protein